MGQKTSPTGLRVGFHRKWSPSISWYLSPSSEQLTQNSSSFRTPSTLFGGRGRKDRFMNLLGRSLRKRIKRGDTSQNLPVDISRRKLGGNRLHITFIFQSLKSSLNRPIAIRRRTRSQTNRKKFLSFK